MIGSDPTINYSNQGLNNRLQPVNSLPNRNLSYTTATEFGANTEGGAIGNYNMGSINAGKVNAGTISAEVAYAGTLTFGQLKGGTATLGGTTDGNGVLSVNNDAGTEVVRLDKDGVTINTGKMTIKDDSETTIIDAKGLVSAANFASDSVVNSTGRSYSNSAAYEDIANTSITTSSLARSTEVLILYTVNVVEFPLNGTTAFAGKVTLRIDSTDQTNNNFELQLTSLSSIANVSAWGGPLTAVGIVTLAAGTHTLKLRAQTINTNSQLNVESTSLVYIVLGA